MSVAPGEALVELSGVGKAYRTGEVEVPVLHGVELLIRAGDYVAIMGRSGSGKSTLMHIIGLLDQPSIGPVSPGRRLPVSPDHPPSGPTSSPTTAVMLSSPPRSFAMAMSRLGSSDSSPLIASPSSSSATSP